VGEKKIIEMEDHDKRMVTKVELAKKMIEVHQKINQTNERVAKIEKESADERRKMTKDFDRKIKEVKMYTLGNKSDIKKLYRRSSDNTENIEKMQSYISWTIKSLLGVLIVVIVTGLLNIFFGLF
jgi:hypothetical protein